MTSSASSCCSGPNSLFKERWLNWWTLVWFSDRRLLNSLVFVTVVGLVSFYCCK